MSHLKNFTVHQYRGLKGLEMKDLCQINLLVGNNNSGKTSLLEAVSIYCDPFNWRKWLEAASNRETTNTPIRTPLIDRLTWLFPQRKTNNLDGATGDTDILISAAGSFPIEKISASYSKFTELTNSVRPLIKGDEVSYEEREIEVEGVRIFVKVFGGNIQKSLFNDDPFLQETLTFSEGTSVPSTSKQTIHTLPVQAVHPFSHRSSSLPSRLWSDVIEADLKSDTINLLRFFDPAIQEVDIISPTERRQFVSVKHEKLGRAPLHTFGDGLRRIFTLATTISRVKNGILLIDELETAIHTQALAKTFDWLIKACVQYNVQLFATTHSLEALDALLEATRNNVDIAVYRLQQEENKTQVTHFDKEIIVRLREELGLEVRL